MQFFLNSKHLIKYNVAFKLDENSRFNHLLKSFNLIPWRSKKHKCHHQWICRPPGSPRLLSWKEQCKRHWPQQVKIVRNSNPIYCGYNYFKMLNFRDFPDLDQIIYDGSTDNNHLMKVSLTFQWFAWKSASILYETYLCIDHGWSDVEPLNSNSDLLRGFQQWKMFSFEDSDGNCFQEAKLDHRIQPETESMIKMILETPFVVGLHIILLISMIFQILLIKIV